MFNFLKSQKSKKYDAIKKQILIWNQACLMGVEDELLNLPRPKVGAILFFIGGIDNLCQANQIDDDEFAKIGIELLEQIGFPSEVIRPIFVNFYTQQNKNEFALKANIEGGKLLSEFLSGKNEMAPLAFGAYVRDWAEEPDLKAEDLYLMGV